MNEEPMQENQVEEIKIKDEAFYGLAGEVVKTISPHSEADPVALLATFLTAYGNLIGDKAYFEVESTKHPMRLFCVLVGDSSKARKGTSWKRIESIFNAIEPEWRKEIKTGLSSGEGLIWAVRDEIRKPHPIKEKGRIAGYEEITVDEGVTDKRLFINEEEFASSLRIMERDGNILSPIIRCAWDSGNLQVLTKNAPVRATNAHISIIGHITRAELVKYLTATETGNGFGNRFMWLYVKRSKLLPFGGGLSQESLIPLIRKLKAAVEFGKNAEQITWAEKTRIAWQVVYGLLSKGKPGLIGALTARAEAYVTRLACIYALLDFTSEIRKEHLHAAISLWEYAEASVRFIFGDIAETPLVREIREVLRQKPEGMSKTEIINYFQRNRSANEVQEALDILTMNKKAVKETVKTDGRDKAIWRLKAA